MARPPAKFGIYPSYLFRDHDPVLDAIDTIIGDSEMTIKEVSIQSHVSTGTLHNWRKRKVKAPQFKTVAAVLRSIGAEITITYRNRRIDVRGIRRMK